MTISDATIANNSAANTGGVLNIGPISGATIANNSARNGGGGVERALRRAAMTISGATHRTRA